MGVVEDPLVLKKFMGMLSKKKNSRQKKGCEWRAWLQATAFWSRIKSKENRVLLTQKCQWPSYVSSGPQRFFLSLNNFLLHPFLVLLPITHYGEKTYIAWWASAWWPGGLTNAKPFYKTRKVHYGRWIKDKDKQPKFYVGVVCNSHQLTNKPDADGALILPHYLSLHQCSLLTVFKATRKGKNSTKGFVVMSPGKWTRDL